MKKQITIKKPKNYELAEFYGVFRTTISNYKHGDIFKKRLYKAMVKMYQEENSNENINNDIGLSQDYVDPSKMRTN